jgi:hypothetical protein
VTRSKQKLKKKGKEEERGYSVSIIFYQITSEEEENNIG